MEVRRPADLGELPRRWSSAGDRDRVGGLAATVEVDDGVEDRLVRRPVEVRAPDRLDHVGDRVLRQQHRADHALLGVVVLRRRAVTAAPAVPAAVLPAPVVRRGPARTGVQGRSRAAGELRNAHSMPPRLMSLMSHDTTERHPQKCGDHADETPVASPSGECRGWPHTAYAKADGTCLRAPAESPLSTGPGDNRVPRVERADKHVHRLFTHLWTTCAQNPETRL